jgi:hypothetical protein
MFAPRSGLIKAFLCSSDLNTKAYVEHYINNILFEAGFGKFELGSYSDSSENALLRSVITDQSPSNQITTVLENNSQNTIYTGQQL